MPRILLFTLAVLISIMLLSACKPDSIPEPTPQVPLSKSVKVVHDTFQGVPIVVAGSGGRNLIVSFERKTESGTELQFIPSNSSLPVIMEDTEGTKWNIFGEAVEGPRQGEKLRKLNAYMGYWFAFGAIYPGAHIYGDTRAIPEVKDIPEPSENWLVSKTEVFAGAGKDGIPSLDYPKIDIYKERDYLDEPGGYYLQDEDLVVGIKIGESWRAYPHAILNWHEIVNDTIGSAYFSLVYCPFTGTATVWDRIINGVETTFGVSGLLYNNNVIPYDRQTESYWSQMLGISIRGQLIGDVPTSYTIVETSWQTWNSMFPQLQILSPETGVDRDYSDFPYGSYRTNHNSISFPLTYDDNRLPRKERVHGIIIDGKVKVYRLEDF